MRTVCKQDEYRKGKMRHNHAVDEDIAVDILNKLRLSCLQLSCAGSGPGGPGALRGQPIGSAATASVATSVATAKLGQTWPEGCQRGDPNEHESVLVENGPEHHKSMCACMSGVGGSSSGF